MHAPATREETTMARDVKNASMTDAANQTAMNNQLEQQRQQQGNQLQATYNSLLTTGYANPQAQAAETNAAMGGLGATYDNLKQSAMNTAARTRNDAALPALLDKLAMDKGSQGAQIASNQVASGVNSGVQGLSSLYGTNTDFLAKALGLPNEYLQTANTASQNPWLNVLGSALGAGGTVGAAAIKQWG